MAGSHGWQGFEIASHRSAPSFALVRPESRLAGGRGSPSHLPGRGGKSEAVYPMSLAPSGSPGKRMCVEQAGEGRGFGGEGEKALITQRQLALKVGWRYEKKVKLSSFIV